jgi:hypothetical protein
MTEEEWIHTYRPKPHPDGESHGFEIDGECCLIEPSEEHILAHIPERFLWTLLENDDGNLSIAAGNHRVKRIGYLQTSFPWHSGHETTESEGVDEE